MTENAECPTLNQVIEALDGLSRKGGLSVSRLYEFQALLDLPVVRENAQSDRLRHLAESAKHQLEKAVMSIDVEPNDRKVMIVLVGLGVSKGAARSISMRIADNHLDPKYYYKRGVLPRMRRLLAESLLWEEEKKGDGGPVVLTGAQKRWISPTRRISELPEWLSVPSNAGDPKVRELDAIPGVEIRGQREEDVAFFLHRLSKMGGLSSERLKHLPAFLDLPVVKSCSSSLELDDLARAAEVLLEMSIASLESPRDRAIATVLLGLGTPRNHRISIGQRLVTQGLSSTSYYQRAGFVTEKLAEWLLDGGPITTPFWAQAWEVQRRIAAKN